MLVPRDPLYHSTSESKFAQVCEKTTELHFDPLPKQLKEVLESTVKANQWREESASERLKSTESQKTPKTKTHETTLTPGDVYCTRHSNLKNVQVCEKTTELHFDPLPKQLKEVLESTVKANQWREESASERLKSTESQKTPKTKTHETTLTPGDVYCTRHSNLKNVQVLRATVSHWASI
ncbi:hypothetical protein OESDEN_19060 [Oesophagostomum dentatum]|uniref:Uncharacterized protein n=1 Tax=Oesophagostomum dentatum TaxID=61180 RepID=A0A0B1S8J7_OESDE|nr:hypothetical protein OESDEN_19060 [Oesophagostomum dentatum]